MAKLSKKKRVAYVNRGDKIEVRLLDDSWSIYREWKIGIKDRGALRKMVEELKDWKISMQAVASQKALFITAAITGLSLIFSLISLFVGHYQK